VSDIGASLAILLLFGIITGALATTHIPAVRGLLWVAFGERIIGGVGQLIYSKVIVHGGDMMLYGSQGGELAKLLDANFGFMFPEMSMLLLQRPSLLDNLIGGGTNTGSMSAAVGFLMYFEGGSEYAAHATVTGLAMLGTFSIYKAFQRTAPDASPVRLFIAVVLLPSTVFWTSAFHKESFAVAGLGLLLSGWRAFYDRRWIRFILVAPLGLGIVYIFRAPILAPILLGFVIYFIVERARRTRGVEATVVGPFYLFVGLGLLAVGMIVLGKLVPSLGIDKLGETVSERQHNWTAGHGGSTFASDADTNAPTTLAGQLFRVPLALVNALFRPQFFDVNNFAAAIAAVEMTIVSWVFIRGFRRLGFGGVVRALQASPLLIMCSVVTVVGATFVGLVTLNFGSLARYRVPFLPFYVTMLVGLLDHADAAQDPQLKKNARRIPQQIAAMRAGRRSTPAA
jgi:hypothetical protein